VVFPQPLDDHVREQLRADLAVGAQLRPVRSLLGVPAALWAVRRRRATYYVAAGGSSPTGSLGFVSAGLELAQQIATGELERPDAIYLALGSCGTVAGLQLGLACAGLSGIEVVGVRVVDRMVSGARAVRALIRGMRPLLGDMVPAAERLPSLRIEHGFFGGAYGRATPAALDAVTRAAAVGVRLEPTYTGKAMAALLSDAASGRLDGKRVLFFHTYNGVDLGPLLVRAPDPARVPGLRRYFPRS
jgi:1-aminocyclopropane-1-carboxylate deaminase/D-cysteine desulfhydrase-like pyridoxal-dependent ACC family enzyme